MNESEQRSYDVAMSVEALASAWARTEGAPAGSVVVAETEVSGRLRGGVPWTLGGVDALSMAIVVRPNIAPMKEALLWTAATLAAAEALTTATGTEHGVVWPDRIAASAAAVVDLAVAVAVFAEFHGHGPFDALAATFLNVGVIVLLLDSFGKGLVGFKESFFEVFGFVAGGEVRGEGALAAVGGGVSGGGA